MTHTSSYRKIAKSITILSIRNTKHYDVLESREDIPDSSEIPPTPLEIDKKYGISTNTCTKYDIMHKIMINGLFV